MYGSNGFYIRFTTPSPFGERFVLPPRGPFSVYFLRKFGLFRVLVPLSFSTTVPVPPRFWSRSVPRFSPGPGPGPGHDPVFSAVRIVLYCIVSGLGVRIRIRIRVRVRTICFRTYSYSYPLGQSSSLRSSHRGRGNVIRLNYGLI